MSEVIAILCSDIHLSHTPPVARSAEPDWYEAQARPLRELKSMARKYGVPIICAGDVFDRWNSPPELINWAIRVLPKMIAIPGQHDLPHHNLDEIRRSAFWTLVESNIINPGEGYSDYWPNEKLGLWFFPWGESLFSLDEKQRSHEAVHLAVIHKYVWKRGHGYPGAPYEAKVGGVIRQLRGFDCVACGDNHSGFIASLPQAVINCGCLIRRKQDERLYRPMVGLMRDDASIEPHYLDTSLDKWIEPEQASSTDTSGLEEFLTELSSMSESDSLDFRQTVRQYLESHSVSKDVEQLLLSAMGEE